MAHRHVCTRRVFEQPRLLRPRNRKNLLRSVVAKNIALVASSERTQQHCDGDPHPSVMKELRSHFSELGILTNIGIVDVLRRWHPNHTITQTPKSTGILKLAKAGYADATLDTEIDFYAARTYKPATFGAKGTGRLKDKVEFGRYKYRWKDQDFQVYVADYWETEYSQVKNHYILYPRDQGDIIDGRSRTVDNLITAATQHLSEIKEEIWVYDRGYWRKNHKLWKNVQGCKWENVILNNETKLQLISDIEGFFDRKEDYESFAVPWKVSEYGIPLNPFVLRAFKVTGPTCSGHFLAVLFGSVQLIMLAWNHSSWPARKWKNNLYQGSDALSRFPVNAHPNFVCQISGEVLRSGRHSLYIRESTGDRPLPPRP